MIRIQKLKEPKKTSGLKLDSGKLHTLQGVQIKNGNKFPVYIDSYERKKPVAKVILRKKK